jgi:hypothetical protein
VFASQPEFARVDDGVEIAELIADFHGVRTENRGRDAGGANGALSRQVVLILRLIARKLVRLFSDTNDDVSLRLSGEKGQR